jgi:hypothetical protein
MYSAVQSAQVAPGAGMPQPASSVVGIHRDGPKPVCICADGRELPMSHLVAAHVQVGDEISAPASLHEPAADTEIYIRKPSLRRADIYNVRISYAALPKPDRRGELFVRVQVVDGQSGIEAIHIPSAAIRDYFFAANRRAPWQSQTSFYYLLHLPTDVPFKELRLGYRVRRMELLKQNASANELATIERAYNVLADPDLRALYDALRKDPTVPVPFPYSGFGSLLVQGERPQDGNVFFANRILAFLPKRSRRTVPVPLRKLDYFDDYAILRDHKRKIEVLIDHQLLPLRWDPTWSQWRHLIPGVVHIAADFIHTGRYRQRQGEWKLIEWDTALPSRTELEVPEGLEEQVLQARRTHSRFGQYWKQIDRLRAHVEKIPTERDELSRLCWKLGLPGDFDVAQITWRPDYDPYYYEQLIKRARMMFLFRDEYIFDLPGSVAVEVPRAGRATYVFTKPPAITEWVWQYTKTTRQDIRLNRENIAQSLGFVGRVVHGSSKTQWVKDLRLKIGEPPDYPDDAR